MARFLKTWNDGTFIGWDDISPNAKCTEATFAGDLGVKMSSDDVKLFSTLEPGQRVEQALPGIFPITYFREW